MGDAEPRTLGSVIEIIPPSCYENPTWKGLAYAARAAALHALVLVGLAATDAWYLLLPLWALSALTVSGLFIIAHDSAHQALFKSERLCWWVGQLAMLPSLHVYEAWVLGHNRIHHGHTVRGGVDFVWHPLSPAEYAALPRLAKLRHRLEWSAFGSGLYYLRDVWWNKMIVFTPPAKLAAAIRFDWWFVAAAIAAATLGLGALGYASYGTFGGAVWTWFKLLVVPWLLFNQVIGWVVYVHHIAPDIEWHPRSLWTKYKGQMQGTTILRVPAVLELFFHHIFLHVPHHVDMRIPFYGLPEASEAILRRFPDVVHEKRLSLRDYLQSVRRCKLYDFERGAWLTYREADRALATAPAPTPASAPAA
jgi:omega-6 fatty acid desaturase (delta-12 desaturase)